MCCDHVYIESENRSVSWVLKYSDGKSTDLARMVKGAKYGGKAEMKQADHAHDSSDQPAHLFFAA